MDYFEKNVFVVFPYFLKIFPIFALIVLEKILKIVAKFQEKSEGDVKFSSK